MCKESVHNYYAHMTLRSLELDPATIKVMAHPLRWRLVTELRLNGPQTATELAATLGTNSGATSYHLRKLADAGLVTDTGSGTGRRRVWEAASDVTDWTPSRLTDGDEDTAVALNWLEHDYFRHFAEKYGQWLDVRDGWPALWQDAAGASDYPVVVTPEQLTAMHEEIWGVLEKYRRVGAGNPGARRIAAYVHTYPIDLDRPPTRGER